MSVDEAVYASFADTGKVEGWAVPAMKWAVTHDIISGKIIEGQKYMAPLSATPREECATMIVKLAMMQ